MPTILQQVLFLFAFGAAAYLVARRWRMIAGVIKMGQPEPRAETTDGRRLPTMLRVAFGQSKMFDRPVVGLLHFVIYAGFVLINIEILEIILDGLTGQHRLFAPILGPTLYSGLINFFELLALGVVLSCIAFLWRRNGAKLERFQKREMKGWPTLDANTILVWEVALMAALFTMNATDSILQGREGEYVAHHYTQVGSFLISQAFIPLYDGLSTATLIGLERGAWWIHILGIMAFAVYVSYSKHLHIFLAFPSVYFSRFTPNGEMENMEKVTEEVKSMMDPNAAMEEAPAEEEIGRFGAKDVPDLSWKNIMEAYSCTECGRCTSECPANLTGKLLSPRKIMMDTRDRAEEIAQNALKAKNGAAPHEDGKSLYGDYIQKEELMACTTCNACVSACPINISPLDIILKMRRYIAMEEADTPGSWNAMSQNVENNFAPWAMPAADRFKWADELKAEAEQGE